MIKQVLGRVAVVPKGEWAEGSLYTRLDVVMHGGRGWICAAADTTTEEPGAGADWQLIAEKGDPFTYGDFTEEQVAGLMKPATDAAAEIAKTDESYRAMLEQQAADFSAAQAGRKSAFEEAEINRANSFMQAEALRNATFNERERGRISAEDGRSEAEQSRVSSEQARVQAETQRKSDTAAAIKRLDSAVEEAGSSIAEQVERSKAATESADGAAASASKAASDANAAKAACDAAVSRAADALATGLFVKDGRVCQRFKRKVQ